MKALATGQAYNEVSLTNDSDIFSLQGSIYGDVSSWIPPPPNIVPHGSLDPLGRFGRLSPNTKLGTLRSVSVVRSRVVGLYLEEQNVGSLMEYASIAKQQLDFSRSEARSLVNFVTQWNDMIVLKEGDLATLERSWTGSEPPEYKTPALDEGDTIYTMLEFATYISPYWEIVREMTYLAISKAAFDILIKLAAYSKRHHGINALPEIVRPCSDVVLNDAVACLCSGSPSQILMAAVTCSSFALYSLPDRQRSDYAPPTEAIGFGHLRHSRLRSVVSRFQKLSQLAQPKKVKMNKDLSIKMNRRIIEERDLAIERCRDISLVRITENQNDVSQERPHETESCARCQGLSQSKTPQVRRADHIELSANGVALVEALNLSSTAHATHDVCLFVTDGHKEIEDQMAMAGIIEDLLRSGSLYHTIRHPFPHPFNGRKVFWYDTIWNLPLPQRPPTLKQRQHIQNWTSELRREDITTQGPDTVIREKPLEQLAQLWDKLQLTLYFLNRGLTWETATQKVKDFLSSVHTQSRSSWELQGNRRILYTRIEAGKRRTRKTTGEYEDSIAWFLKNRAPKLGVGDGNVREYHGSEFTC